MTETSYPSGPRAFRPWIAGLCLALASPILLLAPASGEDGAAEVGAGEDDARKNAARSSGGAATSSGPSPSFLASSPPPSPSSSLDSGPGVLRYPFGPVLCPPFAGFGERPAPPSADEFGSAVDTSTDAPAARTRLCPPVAIDQKSKVPDAPNDNDENTASSSADRLAPTNHTVNWLERHGDVARSADDQCTDCHTEDDCADCHDEKRAEPFSVHPPNFETLHAAKARGQERDCADCHNVDTFCTKCHTRADVAPEPAGDPPDRYDVHPEDWTDPDAPRNHAVMARRNIEDCASCHTERDCVTCHESVDPHPPEFRLKCDQWLESNPRPCTKCHQDLDRLERRCL